MVLKNGKVGKRVIVNLKMYTIYISSLDIKYIAVIFTYVLNLIQINHFCSMIHHCIQKYILYKYKPSEY